jgi:hypothetical protein
LLVSGKILTSPNPSSGESQLRRRTWHSPPSKIAGHSERAEHYAEERIGKLKEKMTTFAPPTALPEI